MKDSSSSSVSKTSENILFKAFRSIIDFIIPLQCASCEAVIPGKGGYICSNCLDNLTRIPSFYLRSEFRKKFSGEGVVDDFWAAYIFEQGMEIQKIVHHFKYNKKFLIALSMGELLGKLYLKEHPFSGNDLIIPVPLHYRKKIQRGYNQSDYLARGFGKAIGIPVVFSAVKRIKNTKTQTGLHLLDRKENMHKAFLVKNPEIIRNKNIVLIDDVITTGATISECAKMLKASGAKSVNAISLALAE